MSTIIGNNAYKLIKLTPARQAIVAKLNDKLWFQQTTSELQVELATLPQNHDGFLNDMVGRPEKLGGVTVLSLIKLARGNFAVTPVFNVINSKGEMYTYEYVSWRLGRKSGAKGLICLLNDERSITHFVLRRGEKFATGKTMFDCIGGFLDFSNSDVLIGGVEKMVDCIKREILEELGMSKLEIKYVVELGSLHPDSGMTNNKPELFIALVDGKDAESLPSDTVNVDEYELDATIEVFPIRQLLEVARENSDAYFLAIAMRAIAYGVISTNVLVV